MSLKTALQNYLNIDVSSMRPAGFLDKEASQIKTTVSNVNRGHGWIPNLNCPACGSERSEIIMTRFGRNVLQCRACEIGYMEGFPADLGDVYSHEGYNDTQETNYLHNVDYRKQRFAFERLNIIRRHITKPASSTRLLDIGCGTGWFLEVAMREGFPVSGLEMGKEIAQATSRRLKIRIYTEAVAELPASEQFDVITLFDVLEHVPDPAAVLRAVREHLRHGGIALLFTPNLDSVGLSILRERSSLVMPAEHLFYFTPKSLRRLIEQTPLEVVEFQTKGMDIPDVMSHFRDDKQLQPVADFLVEQCNVLQAVIDSAGCANHMRFVVRRI
jgi:2-polyprenyl-3-methyl-5-hydroxy-6-metoxy-1,4-benzoquinol methylase